MTVLQVAKRTRKACESYAKETNIFAEDLNSMCAIASAYLMKRLSCARIRAEFVIGTYDGSDHCWVEHKDKIIDITATQFGILQAVFVTSKYNKDYFAKCRAAQRIARTFLIKENRDWPYNQRLTSKNVGSLEDHWKKVGPQ